jgi:hypothetical protein
MTRTAFNRDNVLSDDERAASSRKCVSLLRDHVQEMTPNERGFFTGTAWASEKPTYQCTERQLAWLRDMVEKYAQ